MPADPRSRPDMPQFAVVVPVYRNRESLRALVERLTSLNAELEDRLEAIFVVDGCPDGSDAALRQILSHEPLCSRLIVLSRNFGSFAAIQTGLAHTDAPFICVMSADLQEPVSFAAEAFHVLSAGSVDVVVGEREGRNDETGQTLASGAFWGLYRNLVNPDIPAGGVDMFACTQRVAGELVRLSESHSSLIGLLYWVGFRRTSILYTRQPRHSGTSAWTVRRRFNYLTDSVFSFTNAPLVFLQVLGALGVMISVLVGIAVLISWSVGAIGSPGYTPLILTIVGSTSAILLGLGIVGSYTWRAYENTKGRPATIVATIESFE